jgi:hypothetical protein
MRPVVLSTICVLFGACAAPNGAPEPGGGEAVPTSDLATSLEVVVRPADVRLVLHVTNTARTPVTFTFPTSQRYDFMVETESGEPVWHWSGDRAFLQVITEARLEPGETWTVQETWDPGSRVGGYVAVARLVAMDRPAEQRAAFRLP